MTEITAMKNNKKILCASCGKVKVSIYKGICDKCKKELDKHKVKPEGEG